MSSESVETATTTASLFDKKNNNSRMCQLCHKNTKANNHFPHLAKNILSSEKTQQHHKQILLGLFMNEGDDNISNLLERINNKSNHDMKRLPTPATSTRYRTTTSSSGVLPLVVLGSSTTSSDNGTNNKNNYRPTRLLSESTNEPQRGTGSNLSLTLKELEYNLKLQEKDATKKKKQQTHGDPMDTAEEKGSLKYLTKSFTATSKEIQKQRQEEGSMRTHTNVNEDSSAVISLLFNECSMMILSRWAATAGDNYNNHTKQREKSSCPITSTTTINNNNIYANWCIPTLPVSNRRCMVCFKFGHYEVECSNLQQQKNSTTNNNNKNSDNHDLKKQCQQSLEMVAAGVRRETSVAILIDKEKRELAAEEEEGAAVAATATTAETSFALSAEQEESPTKGKHHDGTRDDVPLKVSGSPRMASSSPSNRHHTTSAGATTTETGGEGNNNNMYYDMAAICKVCCTSFCVDDILLCDGCDDSYHYQCCNPPLVGVPHGSWFCDTCVQTHAHDDDVSSVEDLEPTSDDIFVIEQTKECHNNYNMIRNTTLGFNEHCSTTLLSMSKKMTTVPTSTTTTSQEDKKNLSNHQTKEQREVMEHNKRRHGHGRTNNLSHPHKPSGNPKRSKEWKRKEVDIDEEDDFVILSRPLQKKPKGGGMNDNDDDEQSPSSPPPPPPPPLWDPLKEELDARKGTNSNDKNFTESTKTKIETTDAAAANTTTSTTFHPNVVETLVGSIVTWYVNTTTKKEDTTTTATKGTKHQNNDTKKEGTYLVVGEVITLEERSSSNNGLALVRVLRHVDDASFAMMKRTLPTIKEDSSASTSGGGGNATTTTTTPSASSMASINIGASVWIPLKELKFIHYPSPSTTRDVSTGRDLEHALKSELRKRRNGFGSYNNLMSSAAAVGEEGGGVGATGGTVDGTTAGGVVHVAGGAAGGPIYSGTASATNTMTNTSTSEAASTLFSTAEAEETGVYQAERILDEKLIKGKRQYLIKWKGWSLADSTWEPEENILSQNLVRIFRVEQLMNQLGESPEAHDVNSVTSKVVEALEDAKKRLRLAETTPPPPVGGGTTTTTMSSLSLLGSDVVGSTTSMNHNSTETGGSRSSTNINAGITSGRVCPFCFKWFQSTQASSNHIRIHEGESSNYKNIRDACRLGF